MSCTQTIFSSEELKITRYQFWQAAWIWISKPHTINKCIFGAKTVRVFRCLEESLNGIVEKLVHLRDVHSSSDLDRSILDHISSKISVESCSEDDTRIFSSGSFLHVRHLLFKKVIHSNRIEICFIDYSNDQVLFYNELPEYEAVGSHPSIVSFVLKFDDDKIQIRPLKRSREVKYEWLQFILLPKLAKWARESTSDGIFRENNAGSLNLIASDRYNELYSLWREKYGKELILKWTESTDPLKFVYEDIAIAAYLSLLWADNKVNFVDLGCGNGLLVYILTQEGHQGRGIDIRPRKIWSSYPSSTILQTATVTPENHGVHSNADWLIGNHSDELTPWIPIFAARSSPQCKFFLLPCCAYELSGQKFRRKNSSCSIYSDYIMHVKNLCEELGFDVFVDRLRIPSTKRICLVGNPRLFKGITQIEDRVKLVLSKYQSGTFIPREAVEKVRNCTKVDRSVTRKICDTISNQLIQRQLADSQSTDVWSSNYSLNFEDAVRLLDPTDLKKLKHECGGLQTLLKNNHSVFMVHGGRIYFRKPNEKQYDAKKWKSKPCWFHNNHPMKCPLPENKCSFFH